MTTNPNEYQMVARERAVDARHEAEQWRQRQALKTQGQPLREESALVIGLRHLIRRLRPAPRAEVRQPSRSGLSGQRS